MMKIWLYAVGSVFIISFISLVGIAFFKYKRLRKALFVLVSFSAGALMGDAFIHLLPEAVSKYGFTANVSLFILIGVTFFFIVEKAVHWRHCHHVDSDHVHPYAVMNLVGDAVHNVVDGLVIGASYLVSIHVGIATTIAVIIHEIPQEFSDFGVLLQGGFSKKKALLMNFLVALGALAGVAAALLLSTYVGNMTTFLIPFSAGAFVYISGADLIPELHKEINIKKSIIQLLAFLSGIITMFLLLFVG